MTVTVPQDSTRYVLSGGGTTNDDGDYEFTFSIGTDGTGEGEFTLTPEVNEIFEAHQTISINATATLVEGDDDTERSASTSITLQDDDHEVTLTAAPTSVKEEDGTERITVTATLTDARRTDISVPVIISENAQFYSLSATSLMIDIDATDTSGTETFEITPVDNDTYNGNLKVTIDVDSGGSDLVLRDTASIEVVDDEALPSLALSVDPEEIAEGGGGQRVMVTAELEDGVLLATNTTVTVSIDEDEDQYSLSSSEIAISIRAGQTSGQGSVTITPESDNIFEDNMAIGLNAEAELIAGDDDSERSASASVTIVDDDHQVSLSVNPSVIEMGETTDVTVKATLVNPAVRNMTVDVMLPESGDRSGNYELTSTAIDDATPNILSIAIEAGDTEGTATLSVDPDAKFAPADPAYNASVDIDLKVDPTSVVAGLGTKVTIVDSKVLPGLTLTVDTDSNETGNQDTILEMDDAESIQATTVTVMAALDLMDDNAGTLPAAFDVMVEVPSNAMLYELGDLIDGVLTINVGTNGSGSGTFTITPGADQIFEAHTTITLSAEATLIDGDDSSKRTASDDITLLDDDHELTLAVSPNSVGEEDGETRVTVTATLTDVRRTDITVPVTITENTTFYGLSESVLMIDIDANDMIGTESFDITPVDNDTYDGNQEITVTIDDSESDLVLRDSRTITVVDDESLPNLVISVDPEEVDEGGGGQRVMVTASLEDGVLLPTSTTVTISVSEDDNQYSLSGDEITISIPANSTSGTGSVTITPVADDIFEATATSITFTGEAVLIDGDDDSERSGSASVTIVDDDHQVSLSASPSVIDDGEATDVTVKATLVNPTPRDIMVSVAVGQADNQEYTVTGLPEQTVFTNNVLSIMIDAGDTEGTADINIAPSPNYAETDGFYDASASVELDIDDNSVVAGLGSSVSIVDTKDIPGLTLTVDMDDRTITEGDDPTQVTATTVNVTASLDLKDGDAGALRQNLTVTVEVPEDMEFYSVADITPDDTDGNLSITITGNDAANVEGTGTFALTPGADEIFEAHQTITLKASADITDDVTREASADITLQDDDHELMLTVSKPEIKEEDGEQTVTVTAALKDTRRTKVTIPVTITANSTYYSLSKSVLMIDIDANENEGTESFVITPLDNNTYNGNQEITITLDESRSDLVLRDSAKITLVDDENLPDLVLSVDPEEIAEGGGGQRVMVTAELEEGVLMPTATLVTVTVDENDDQYSLSGTEFTISISAGGSSGSGSITVTPVSDNIFEASATQIKFTGKAQLIDGDDDSDREASASVSIVDDDHQVTLFVSPAVLTGSTPKDVTVTANLVRPAVQDITIMVSVPDDAARSGNYTIVNEDALDDTNDILSIPISASNSSGSIELLVDPDDRYGNLEYDSPVEISLGIASGSALAGLGTKITIVDDKSLPGLAITALVDGDESFEEGDPVDGSTPVTVNVSAMLDLGSDGGTLGTGVDVTIEISESDAFYTLDDLNSDGNLVIPNLQNATAVTGTFTILPVRDTIFEAHQTITLKATATLIAGDDDSKREATATLTLEDDDHEVTLAIDPTSVSEDGGTEEITVTARLTDDRRSDIAIPVIISQSSAYYSLSESAIEIEIDAGDTSGEETFEITPVDNETYNGNQRVTISLDGTQSDLVLRDNAVLTLEDDEGLPALVLFVSPSQVTEGGGGQRVMVTATLEDGVLLPATTTVDVEVSEDDDQYSLSANSLTIQIPANGTTGQGSITITPVDDILFETHQAITFTASAQLVAGDDNAERETTATVSLQDDDQEVTLSLSRSEVPELGGDHDVVVTANLVRPSPIDVMVEVRIPSQTEQDDSLYNLSIDGNNAEDSFDIMIDAGDTSGMATLTVTPMYSPAYSGSKTITLSGRAVRGATILIRDNEEVRVQLATTIASMTEDGGSQDVEITASLDGRLVNAVTITLSLEGEADRGDDYTVSGVMEIEIGSGSTSGSTTLTFTPVDELLYENNETIIVAGSSSGNQTVSSTEITLNDNNAVPLASVVVNPVTIGEGDGPTQMTIRANLAGTSGEDIVIGLSKPGDAKIGVDFKVEVDESEGEFVVSAGNKSATKTVTIVPVDDEIYELDETFRVVVTASLRDADTRIAGSESAEVTLVDNDPLPMITMLVDPVSVSEDGGDQLVTITAMSDRESSMDIPVALSKSGTAGLEGTESADPEVMGSVDYAISVAEDAGDLMVAAGEMSGSKEITITPVNDDIYEGDEVIMVNGTIMDSEGGEVAAESAVLMLTDDETFPTLVALTLDTESIMEAGDSTAVTVTGTLSHRSTMPISLPLSISETSTAMVDVDYTVSGLDDTMEFAALETETSASLSVTPIQDTIYERDETIVVEGQAGDDESAEKMAAMAITLVDDDLMPVVTLSLNPESVSEEGGTQSVEVTGTLSHESSMPIKTALSVTGDDFTVGDLDNIVVAAGDMSSTITFMITPDDDDVYEANPMITINGSVGEEGVEAISTTLTLTEDETVPTIDLSINPMAVSESDGGHTDVTVTATASGKSALNVVVGLDISGVAKMGEEGDYTINDDAVMEIVIPVLNTSGTTELQVTPIDDNIYERAENVILSAVVGDDAEAGASVELTVNDNDAKPTVALSVMPDMIPEEGPDQDVTITATASHPSSMPITVTLAKEGTAAKGDDYTIGAGSASEIVIDPYETVMDASVMIQPVDDALYEQNEDIEVMGTVDVGGEAGEDAASTNITIVDNDPKPMVTLTTDVDSIEEMGGKVEVTVTAELSGLSSMPIDIALDKAGTAAKGEDYAPAGDPNITVEPGESTGSTVLVFEPLDDDIYENTETIVINGSFADKTAQPASIDLVDDETMPMINLVAMPGAISEDLGAQDVTVMGTATGQSSMPITVDLSFSGSAVEGMDGDFTVSGSSVMSVTVEPLELEGSTVLSIIPVDDVVYENVEAIMIDGSYGTASAGSSAEVALMDDEVMPTIDLSVDPGTIAEEGGSQDVMITGTASGLASMPITVDVSLSGTATNPGDYGVSEGEMSLTVAPLELTGNTVLSIITVDDPIYENDEEIMISGTVDGEVAGAPTTLTLADNETIPTIKLSAGPGQIPSVTEDGGAQMVTITATASGLSSMDIEVMLSLSDMDGLAGVGDDFGVTGDMMITVSALATEGSTELTITPVDDEIYEQDENIVIDGSYVDQMAESVSLILIDNDMMPTVSMTIDNLSVMEEGGAQDVTLTLTASGRSSWPITRTVSISGTAGDPDDYAVSGELTITVEALDLEGSSTLNVTPVDDAIYEGDETIVISGSEDDVGEFTITVVDNEPKPTFALSVDVDSITEEGGAQDVMVTATASGLSSMDLMVSLTKSGTAEKGVDYEPAGNPEIVVAAGELTGYTMLTFTTVDDAIYEQDESIVIGGTEDVTATATVTIVDNEMMPTIALSIDPGSIDENGGDQEVTVTGTASGVSSMDISKTISLASGSADLDEDYSVNGDMVITVAAGDLEGGTVLTVTPENDVIYENTETIMVEGGDEGSETPILMLMDDEVMPSVALSLNPESVTENGGHQNVMLAATASGLSKFDIPVSLGFTGTATFGEDMNIAVLGPGGTMIPIFSISPVLNVAAGTLETSLVVVFQPIDDNVYEGSETITVHGQIGDMLASPATLTIIDDEVMPTIKLSLNPDSVTEDGGAQPVVITGTASGLSAMDLDVVVVPLQTSTLTFGADGIIDGDLAFTIPALELEGSTTVTALPIDDSLYETDEYVHLVGRIGDMVSDPVTLTVIDNDAPAIALTASPASIREDGGSQTVSLDVVMSGITVPVDTEISLALSGTASSADYSVAGTQAIVIAAGDSEAGTQLTFAVVADDVYEPSNETIVISASYSGTNIGDATVTVIDDYEPPSVVGAIPDISLEAGDSRQMDVASSFSGRSLVFSAVSSDAGIASATISGSSLTIEGIRKGASRVTVTAANDASSASFEIGVTVTAIAAEKMVYTDILAAMGRNILSSVSQTIGGRFSVNAAERQMALANRRVDGMASGMEALIGLSGTQATTKYGITDDTLERNRRQPVATRELMRGTSFYYALDDTPTPQGGGEDGLSFTIWGAGDWNAFEGSPSATSSYNGTLVSGYLGLDVSKTASWIAGVAVSRSMGEADYDVTVTDGTLETTLNSVYPYVHWTGPGCCIEIWGVGGFGTGDVEVPDGTSDLSMSMGMLGVRAQLVGAASGGLDLDLIGDAGIAKLSTAESASASLSDLEVSVQRVRIGLEGSRTSDMGNGMLFTPFAQVAGRYDGGDGQSGNGLEVAGGIRIAGGRAGLEARGRLLAIHTGEEVKEHGVSVVAFVRPVGGQGLSMSVAPRLGADTNVSGDMWRDEPLNDVRRSSRSGVGVKAEIGYGLVPPVLSTLLVTPFGQMDMAGEEQRRMRLGARFGSIGDTTTVLSFELAGERIERSAGVPDHRIGLIGRMSF